MGLAQSQASRAAYFLPPPSAELTHDHPYPASRASAVASALPLPREIVHRILDEAEVWAVCRTTVRHALLVQAGGGEPHGVRGITWRTGQEAAAAGLVDGPGEVWYLVSAPVGCGRSDGRDEREREDWEPADGTSVLGRERAMACDWRRDELYRLAGEGGGGRAEQEEQEEQDEQESQTDGHGQWRLRRVVLETLSRDQGWTVHDDHYGTYTSSYSWFELGLLRAGREVGRRHLVQFNVVAGQYLKIHRVELDGTHPLVRHAREGDRVVLWVRAMEPGWQNAVKRAALTLYAAPFAPH